jgi:hypothetical protein
MNVVSIREYASRPIIEQIEALLEQAKAGRMRAFAFAVKEGPGQHGIGLCGEYRDDPAQVLSVTSRIDYRVNTLLDEKKRS